MKKIPLLLSLCCLTVFSLSGKELTTKELVCPTSIPEWSKYGTVAYGTDENKIETQTTSWDIKSTDKYFDCVILLSFAQMLDYYITARENIDLMRDCVADPNKINLNTSLKSIYPDNSDNITTITFDLITFLPSARFLTCDKNGANYTLNSYGAYKNIFKYTGDAESAIVVDYFFNHYLKAFLEMYVDNLIRKDILPIKQGFVRENNNPSFIDEAKAYFTGEGSDNGNYYKLKKEALAKLKK